MDIFTVRNELHEYIASMRERIRKYDECQYIDPAAKAIAIRMLEITIKDLSPIKANIEQCCNDEWDRAERP